MKNRTVKALQFAELVDMNGFPVRQPLPAHKIEMVDPFLLLHHHAGVIEPGLRPQETGVGPHPHRGFSPVTFVFKGDVHHRDSRGNSQVVKAGGVQWMDAGMGLMHSERPSKEFAEAGGEQEIIQLWVNTPHRFKMDQPNYQALQQEDIPHIDLENASGTIAVIAGNYMDRKGPAKTKSDLIILRGDLLPGAEHIFIIPAAYNLIMYVLDGSIEIEKYATVPGLNMVVFNNDGDGIKIKAMQSTRFILLAGMPLNEHVESYGPFVMSTQTEIMQAMRDYQMGKMGMLIEEFD